MIESGGDGSSGGKIVTRQGDNLDQSLVPLLNKNRSFRRVGVCVLLPLPPASFIRQVREKRGPSSSLVSSSPLFISSHLVSTRLLLVPQVHAPRTSARPTDTTNPPGRGPTVSTSDRSGRANAQGNEKTTADSKNKRGGDKQTTETRHPGPLLRFRSLPFLS